MEKSRQQPQVFTFLELFARTLTISDQNRGVYIKDFIAIRDHVVQSVKDLGEGFELICKRVSSYANFGNNVRIESVQQFEVYLEIQLPYIKTLTVTCDAENPGFVNFYCEDMMKNLEHGLGEDSKLHDLLAATVSYPMQYLRLSPLTALIQGLINDALNEGNNRYVRLPSQTDVPLEYELEYQLRGHMHTVTAKSDARQISIDFIPAIVFYDRLWTDMPVKRRPATEYRTFYGIPWPAPNLHGNHSFLVVNPKMENRLILKNVKVRRIFCLLTAIRRARDIPQLRSHIITSALLHELSGSKKIELQNLTMPFLLLHILDKLATYFTNHKLPFYWNPQLNLLKGMSDEEKGKCAAHLRRTHDSLKAYINTPNVTLKMCAEHFFASRAPTDN